MNRADLESRARQLKQAFDRGDPAEVQRVLRYLPMWKDKKDLKWQSALFVIAREAGFKNWPLLSKYLDEGN